MNWQQLEPSTKAAVVATVAAVVTALVPPISMAIAVLAIVISGTAVIRHRGDQVQQRVARTCLVASTTLVALVVIGSAIYAAGN